jgi:ATP-dependent DNA helicase RecQ
VPAYVIFHDATLREIARAMPVTLDELRQVSGVGEKKLETYGAELIDLVSGQEAA